MPARRFWFLAALVCLLGLIPRWPLLTQSLWYDEALRTRLHLVGDPLDPASPLHQRLFRDVHNPLYNAIMAAWIRLAGDSEPAIRVPSLAFAYAAALAIAAWLRRRAPPPWAAALALAALAWLILAPVHVWYSTTAKNNALVMLLGTLALLAYARLIPAPAAPADISTAGLAPRPVHARLARSIPTIRATLAGTLLLYTSWLGAISLLAGLATVLAARIADPRAPGPRVALRRATLALLATAALAAPLVAIKAADLEHVWRGYPRPFDAREAFFLVVHYLPTGNALVPGDPLELDWGVALSAAPTLPILALGLVASLRAARPPAHLPALRAPAMHLLAMLAVFALGTLALRALAHDRFIYQERNAIIALPAMAALLVLGAAALPTRALRVAAVLALLALNAAATARMLTVGRDAWTVFWPTPDWRGALERIAAAEHATARRDADARPAHPAIAIYTPSFLEPLAYHTRRLGLPEPRRPRPRLGETLPGLIARDLAAFDTAPSDAARTMPSDAMRPRTIYVLSDRSWWTLAPGDLAELSRTLGPPTHSRARALDIYRFTAPP